MNLCFPLNCLYLQHVLRPSLGRWVQPWLQAKASYLQGISESLLRQFKLKVLITNWRIISLIFTNACVSGIVLPYCHQDVCKTLHCLIGHKEVVASQSSSDRDRGSGQVLLDRRERHTETFWYRSWSPWHFVLWVAWKNVCGSLEDKLADRKVELYLTFLTDHSLSSSLPLYVDAPEPAVCPSPGRASPPKTGGPDVLTCGQCGQAFPLGCILDFIQHKQGGCGRYITGHQSHTPPSPTSCVSRCVPRTQVRMEYVELRRIMDRSWPEKSEQHNAGECELQFPHFFLQMTPFCLTSLPLSGSLAWVATVPGPLWL